MLNRGYEDKNLNKIVDWLNQEYKQPVVMYKDTGNVLDLKIFIPSMLCFALAYCFATALFFSNLIPIVIFVLALFVLTFFVTRFVFKGKYELKTHTKEPEIQLDPGYKLTLRTWSTQSRYAKSQLVTELDHLPPSGKFVELMNQIENYKSSVSTSDYILDQLDIETDLKYKPLKNAAIAEVNKLLKEKN